MIQVHGGIHQNIEGTGVKFNRSYEYVSEQRKFFQMGTREEYFFQAQCISSFYVLCIPYRVAIVTIFQGTPLVPTVIKVIWHLLHLSLFCSFQVFENKTKISCHFTSTIFHHIFHKTKFF